MVGHCDVVAPFAPGIAQMVDFMKGRRRRGRRRLAVLRPAPLRRSTRRRTAPSASSSSPLHRARRLPAIVERHADGHDVFIELGADSNRANAVKNVLGAKGAPHVAVAIDRSARRGASCCAPPPRSSPRSDGCRGRAVPPDPARAEEAATNLRSRSASPIIAKPLDRLRRVPTLTSGRTKPVSRRGRAHRTLGAAAPAPAASASVGTFSGDGRRCKRRSTTSGSARSTTPRRASPCSGT